MKRKLFLLGGTFATVLAAYLAYYFSTAGLARADPNAPGTPGGAAPTRFIYAFSEQTAPRNASRAGGGGGYHMGMYAGSEAEWLGSFYPPPLSPAAAAASAPS